MSSQMEEVRKAIVMIDDAVSPQKMKGWEALEYLETLRDEIVARIEALHEDMEDDGP